MKILLLILALCLAGCTNTQLAPAGPYAGNSALYVTDQSIDASYRVLDVFLSFELANRATLSQDVRTFANKIRRDAPEWNRRILALRDVYAMSPTRENKASLDTVLKLLREALTQASAYLVEKPAT